MTESMSLESHPPIEPKHLGYLDMLYATLFYPSSLFKSIANEAQPSKRLIVYALLWVGLISLIAPLVHLSNLGGSASGLAIFMPLSLFFGLFAWAFMGSVIGLLAYAFSGRARIQTFLILSGLATLPWLLMGPVSLLKIGLGTPGVIISGLLSVLVWIWSVVLFGLALAETYRMTAEKVLIVLVAPLVMMLISFAWFFGFIENVRHLTLP